MRQNLILNSDSYKVGGHFMQYPEGAEYVYAYAEARAGNGKPYTIVFGPQAFISEYLTKPITMADIDEAEEVMTAHGLPFNRHGFEFCGAKVEGWEYILSEYGGYLPLKIQTVDEGSKLAIRGVMATMVNTDPKVPWLTCYMETAFLRAIWYGTTVATNSHFVKRDLYDYWLKSSDAPVESLDFKLHDFGARGVSSNESAGIGGMAHLVNFKGTDTLAAILAARKYYKADMAGFSIPAAEHSTITSWGKENESKAYANMIEVFDTPLVAIVADSYDIVNACENIFGDELKEKIINSGKTVVVRPDSGDATTMPIMCIELLMDKFGYTTNSKGYRVLPDCVRVIQGDGITPESIKVILQNMEKAKLSIDNLALGMGGGLLQHCNRDTYAFAMKCSAIKINGVWQDVYKNPKSDPSKASKRGRFLDNKDLKTRFIDGVQTNYTTFEEIRERAAV